MFLLWPLSGLEKTVDLAVVHPTVTNILQEGAKVVCCSHSVVSKHNNIKLTGQKNCDNKRCIWALKMTRIKAYSRVSAKFKRCRLQLELQVPNDTGIPTFTFLGLSPSFAKEKIRSDLTWSWRKNNCLLQRSLQRFF